MKPSQAPKKNPRLAEFPVGSAHPSAAPAPAAGVAAPPRVLRKAPVGKVTTLPTKSVHKPREPSPPPTEGPVPGLGALSEHIETSVSPATPQVIGSDNTQPSWTAASEEPSNVALNLRRRSTEAQPTTQQQPIPAAGEEAPGSSTSDAKGTAKKAKDKPSAKKPKRKEEDDTQAPEAAPPHPTDGLVSMIVGSSVAPTAPPPRPEKASTSRRSSSVSDPSSTDQDQLLAPHAAPRGSLLSSKRPSNSTGRMSASVTFVDEAQMQSAVTLSPDAGPDASAPLRPEDQHPQEEEAPNATSVAMDMTPAEASARDPPVHEVQDKDSTSVVVHPRFVEAPEVPEVPSPTAPSAVPRIAGIPTSGTATAPATQRERDVIPRPPSNPPASLSARTHGAPPTSLSALFHDKRLTTWPSPAPTHVKLSTGLGTVAELPVAKLTAKKAQSWIDTPPHSSLAVPDNDLRTAHLTTAPVPPLRKSLDQYLLRQRRAVAGLTSEATAAQEAQQRSVHQSLDEMLEAETERQKNASRNHTPSRMRSRSSVSPSRRSVVDFSPSSTIPQPPLLPKIAGAAPHDSGKKQSSVLAKDGSVAVRRSPRQGSVFSPTATSAEGSRGFLSTRERQPRPEINTSAEQYVLAALMRCTTVQHVCRCLGDNFPIYQPVFESCIEEVEAVACAFDDVRKSVALQTEDREKLRRLLAEANKTIVAERARHAQEINNAAELPSRLLQADEDLRVLKAVNEDLNRQLGKQRQFVENAQQHLDTLSKQQVAMAGREEKLKEDVTDLERQLSIMTEREHGVSSRLKDAKLRVEELSLSTQTFRKNTEVLTQRVTELEEQNAVQLEELEALRVKRKAGGFGQHRLPGMTPQMEAAVRRTLAPEIEEKLRRAMTPRPQWDRLALEDNDVFPKTQHQFQALLATSLSRPTTPATAQSPSPGAGHGTPQSAALESAPTAVVATAASMAMSLSGSITAVHGRADGTAPPDVALTQPTAAPSPTMGNARSSPRSPALTKQSSVLPASPPLAQASPKTSPRLASAPGFERATSPKDSSRAASRKRKKRAPVDAALKKAESLDADKPLVDVAAVASETYSKDDVPEDAPPVAPSAADPSTVHDAAGAGAPLPEALRAAMSSQGSVGSQREPHSADDALSRSVVHLGSSPTGRPINAAALSLVPLTSAERVARIVQAFNARFHEAVASSVEKADLAQRVAVAEALQSALGSNTLPTTASAGKRARGRTPNTMNSGGGFYGGFSGMGAAKGAKDTEDKRHLQPVPSTCTLFSLVAPETRTIPVRPMTQSQVIDLLLRCADYTALWLADADPGKDPEKSPVVSTPPEETSFAEAFHAWVVSMSAPPLPEVVKTRRGKPKASKSVVSVVAPEPEMDPRNPYRVNAVPQKPQAQDPPLPGEEHLFWPATEGDAWSFELAYNILYHAQSVFTGHVLSRVFLLSLAGEVPRDTLARVQGLWRTLRRVLEDTDPDNTGGVLAVEAAQAIKSRLSFMASHHLAALGGLLELQGHRTSHSRVPFRGLLLPTSDFAQVAGSFFLATLQQHARLATTAAEECVEPPNSAGAPSALATGFVPLASSVAAVSSTSREIDKEKEEEEVTAGAVLVALQRVDPDAEEKQLRAWLDTCVGTTTTRGTKIALSVIRQRFKRVFYQRATAVDGLTVAPPPRNLDNVPTLERVPLPEMGASRRRGPAPGSKPVRPGGPN